MKRPKNTQHAFVCKNKDTQPLSCKHQFWKDRNPPNCLNCGKTENELLAEMYEQGGNETLANLMRNHPNYLC